jgi:hypothetical protein
MECECRCQVRGMLFAGWYVLRDEDALHFYRRCLAIEIADQIFGLKAAENYL